MKPRNYLEMDYTTGIDHLDAVDIIKVATQGQDNLAKARPNSPGQLRGGSVGALIDGQIYGICHRKAYLRFHGIEVPLPTEIELMTNQGEKNEDIWYNDLQHGLPEHLYVMDQNMFECKWTNVFGTEGKGSPDLVVFDRTTELPVVGLELKNLSAVSTVKSAHYELRPKTDHLIQAANYSIRMGDLYRDGNPLPYQLVYSNRSIHSIYAMSEKNKKAILDKGWDVDWKFGKPMAIKPFHRIYQLDWNLDGTLKYWTPGLRQWVHTKLTKASIDAYYETVSQKIDSQNNLGPRPTTKHLDGKSSYSPCGYCDWNQICDQYERSSTQEFLDQAKVFAADKWKERLK